MAAVAGTSTCYITLSEKSVFVDGVWGPYRDVLGRDYWCTEGGQNFTGALLEDIIRIHPARQQLLEETSKLSLSKFEYLNSRLNSLKQQRNVRSVSVLAKHLFFYGDYHGNRSPISDSTMKAAMIGQSMDFSINDLAITYYGACEFIAQQARQIVEKMIQAGHKISAIYMSGGQCRNKLLMELLANCTGLPVVIPNYIDSSVIFRSAILGLVASESYSSYIDLKSISQGMLLWRVMTKITPDARSVQPSDPEDPDRILLDTKYKIFLDMIESQTKYRAMVDKI